MVLSGISLGAFCTELTETAEKGYSCSCGDTLIHKPVAKRAAHAVNPNPKPVNPKPRNPKPLKPTPK